jgi:FixJ family two-component response regulator
MRDDEPRMTLCSLVSVVDDDESVRESLPDLLREFGFTARSFSSAEEFLASEGGSGRVPYKAIQR